MLWRSRSTLLWSGAGVADDGFWGELGENEGSVLGCDIVVGEVVCCVSEGAMVVWLEGVASLAVGWCETEDEGGIEDVVGNCDEAW